jgi:hypothetical protein
MKERANERCNRAETRYEPGVSDWILGSTIEVDTTDEGLAFAGGHPTFPWAWIERARKTVIGLMKFRHGTGFPTFRVDSCGN